ncbi:hypothetical protein V1477_021085 [Vespula maculifrons]|uniref:Uncharacterized protein n=1 Tax=Vespula maculifrons TaxID=7453 RepID=A0ABD2AH44_VESMC
MSPLLSYHDSNHPFEYWILINEHIGLWKQKIVSRHISKSILLGDVIDCVRKSFLKGCPTMQAGPSSMKTRNGTEGCLSCKRVKADGTIKKFIE